MQEERRYPEALLDLKPASCEQKNQPVEKNLSSLESLIQLVAPVTLTVNSALATFSMLIENGDEFAQRLLGTDKKEQFREYFLKMRQEYEKVAIIAESMAEFTRLVANQSGRIVVTEQIEMNTITSIAPPDQRRFHPANNPIQ